MSVMTAGYTAMGALLWVVLLAGLASLAVYAVRAVSSGRRRTPV